LLLLLLSSLGKHLVAEVAGDENSADFRLVVFPGVNLKTEMEGKGMGARE
jgi:hypothetical protein